jgi:hypothetical protein
MTSQINIVEMISLLAHSILLFLFTEGTKVIVMKLKYCLFLTLKGFMQLPTIPCKIVLATNKSTLIYSCTFIVVLSYFVQYCGHLQRESHIIAD